MNLFDFTMKIAETEGDLNACLTLMELSRQRDTSEVFQTKIFPKVQAKLKKLGQELIDLGSQEVTFEK